MTEANEVEELRRLISQWRSSGARFATEELRERTAVHALERLKTGLSRRAVAEEIGLNEGTLVWWLERRDKGTTTKKSRGKRGVFQRVRVAPAVHRSELVLHGPRGLRIEGMAVDEVAALIAQLS